MTTARTAPVVLSIAGSDSSCGAGVQADNKAITALGGYALNVITSVVSEVPGLVSRIEFMPGDLVADQLRVLAAAFPIAAIKTGMIGGEEQLRAILDSFNGPCADALKNVPLVIDPVMIATSGRRLLSQRASDLMKAELLPRATLITPNMDEAEVLWGEPVRTREAMAECAANLSQRYACAVLVKGGHLLGATAADVLCDFHDQKSEQHWFESPRVPNVRTHGTGCTYSAAIATGLAKGLLLCHAIAQAKHHITRAIESYFEWHTASSNVQALNHQAPSP